jgi:hypothetical protein
MYNKIDSRNSRGWYDKELGKVMDSGIPCPECGQDTELQLPKEYSRNLINRP